MTILPKKKQTKEKSEASTSDHSHNHQLPTPHSHPPSATEARHDNRVTPRRPNSPPQRWASPTPRGEDPRHGAANHDPGGRFEEFASHEGQTSKRRHRSSPHRNIRKHRGWDPGHASTSNISHRHSGYRIDRPSTSEDLAVASNIESENIEVDELEELSGYNSGDEYVAAPSSHSQENISQVEEWFEHALKEKSGFTIKKMGEDGACLFRAVADQIYGDQEMHGIVRQSCIDHMAKNADFFSQYVTEDFETYLSRKRVLSSHGNHVEIQALSEVFNRPIEVYQYSVEPINIFNGAYKTDNEPIRLSYHGGVHYNSVVDPYKATIGVGLGLPGYKPGSAEQNLMRDAVKKSETFALETTMLEDKLRETDWEVTQETIEEQVARESYLQWLREQEKLTKPPTSSPKSASATCSSASEAQSPWDSSSLPKSPDSRPSRSPRNRSNNSTAPSSPSRASEGASNFDRVPSPRSSDVNKLLVSGEPTLPSSPLPSTASADVAVPQSSRLEGAVGGSATFPETTSLMNRIPPQMYGLSDWDEGDILAQVIAQSQQEYLDTLKRKANTAGSGSDCSSPAGSSSPQQDFSMDFQEDNSGSCASKNSHNNSKSSGSKNS